MGFVFRKSFKVAPGLHLNVSKRGMGVSLGGRNTPRVSLNSSGRVTKSVRLAPGLRYQSSSTLGSKRKRKANAAELSTSDSTLSATENAAATSQNQESVIENKSTATFRSDAPINETVKEPRNLWLPHSIWSVIFFALAGFVSATQNSYDKFSFFLVALGSVFLITYLWNLSKKDEDELQD